MSDSWSLAYTDARDRGYEIYPDHPSQEELANALRDYLAGSSWGPAMPANMIGRCAEMAAARVFDNIDAGHYPAP